VSHELVRTRGGTLAVRCQQAGEIMHPGVGAREEATQLYVAQSGLAARLIGGGAPLVLFDVGLGAGSNAAAAWMVSEAAGPGAAALEIVSFERDVGALELALTQPTAFGLDGVVGEAARQLLAHGRHTTPRTSWRLERGDLREHLPRQPRPADLVFWDPFSPRANPELWTVATFRSLRAVAGDRCALFTYSASTAVRVALLLAGWAVGVGAATGDKRETTAAATRPDDLQHPLDRRWLARVERPDAPLPPDAPADAATVLSRAPQFSVSLTSL
jgi:queuine tRNA-ribosyltransferase